MKKQTNKYPCECLICEYKWVSKVKQPKSCPYCKSYKWNKTTNSPLISNYTQEIKGTTKSGLLILGKQKPLISKKDSQTL